jgi:excisionase family DNA binding protein
MSERRDESELAQVLLSVAQVKAYLNVSTKTVYRRIEDGTLTAVKVGRLYRILASSVTALLNKKCV